jgi:hypothetical protein
MATLKFANRLLFVLCIFTALSNLLMLYPTAWQHVNEIEQLYQNQSSNTTAADLQEMEVTRAELEKSIAFEIDHRSREVWLRWIVSMVLSLAHIAATYLLIRNDSSGARIGLSITSTIYLLGWAGTLIVIDTGSRITVLDAFVERIFMECVARPPFWAARFLLLFCVAPLAYVIILRLLGQRKQLGTGALKPRKNDS